MVKMKEMIMKAMQQRHWLHMLRSTAALTAVVGLLALSASCANSGVTPHQTASVETGGMTTREVVIAFEKMAFDDRNPSEAMLKYASDDFVDHNPNIRGDRLSAIEHLNRLDWSKSGPQRRVVNLVVDGDIAMIHHHLIRNPGDIGIAAVDIFRVKDGKIVEHWDVLQAIPEKSVNPRPMF
jgi:predicted SnoaL-like aldol condensation-catalyzing enzyme